MLLQLTAQLQSVANVLLQSQHIGQVCVCLLAEPLKTS